MSSQILGISVDAFNLNQLKFVLLMIHFVFISSLFHIHSGAICFEILSDFELDIDRIHTVFPRGKSDIR